MKTRVAEGGHYIAPDVIERRYWQGLHLLFANYLPLVDEASLYDNSNGEPILLAQKLADGLHVGNETLYNQLRHCYEFIAMNLEEQIERQEKIAAGLKVAYARMLEFKRQKNSEVVVMRGGKIVWLKP